MSTFDAAYLTAIAGHFKTPSVVNETKIKQIQGIETLFVSSLTYFEAGEDRFLCFMINDSLDDTDKGIKTQLATVIEFKDKKIFGKACRTLGSCPENCTNQYELPHEFNKLSYGEFDEYNSETNNYFLWQLGAKQKNG